MKQLIGFGVVLCATVLVVGCGQQRSGSAVEDENAPSAQMIRRLDVILEAKSGSDLTGIGMFVQDSSGVTLQLELENTTPGEHAVHLHETGDCSAEDATSAGGHWSPGGMDHGKWGEAPFHLGDIGNITVGEDGTGSLTLATTDWTLGSGEINDVLGKAIIVHADPDDFTSQPSGAAGGRIGCGVVAR